MDAVPAVPFEIEVEDLRRMFDSAAALTVLDIREPHEISVCAIGDSLDIPMNQVPHHLEKLPTENPLVVICHHGIRSLRVMAWLRENGFGNAISLRGGINAWAQRVDPAMATY